MCSLSSTSADSTATDSSSSSTGTIATESTSTSAVSTVTGSITSSAGSSISLVTTTCSETSSLGAMGGSPANGLLTSLISASAGSKEILPLWDVKDPTSSRTSSPVSSNSFRSLTIISSIVSRGFSISACSEDENELTRASSNCSESDLLAVNWIASLGGSSTFCPSSLVSTLAGS